jgi:Ca-activated chloride channel homolog
MQYLITRITRILRSPRGALGLFAALLVGTAAVALAPQVIGNSGGASAGNATGPTVHQGTDGVTFSGTLSQTKFVQGGNGVMYLDLSVTTPSATLSPSRVKASDIVVVLDRSGSMAADNRLPYAQEAVRRLVRQLQADDRFALITFDSVAVVDTELTPVTDAVRERIVQRVNAIHPGSSTNISDGLLKACALLQGNAGEAGPLSWPRSADAVAGNGAPLNWRPSADAVAGNGPDGPAPTQSRQRSRKIILLSDGEANMGIVDPKELAKIAMSFTEHRAVLSTIGMGLGFNEALMAALADYGMGHYAYLEHLERLGEILEQDMSDTRQVFASASSLEIVCGDGVAVTDVGGYPVDLTAQPGTAHVATGQLLGGAKKHFVVTMTVPTDHIGEGALGNVTLHYTTSQGTHSIELAPEHLRIAVLEPARRDEAMASVRRDLVQQLWEGNNLGRLQKDYSHWLRAGNKQKAQQAITDYRHALQKAATETGVRVENQAVTDKLSTMEQELNEAFSGPAPQQEEKRNRAAKTHHGESLKSQRSQ